MFNVMNVPKTNGLICFELQTKWILSGRYLRYIKAILWELKKKQAATAKGFLRNDIYLNDLS